MHFSKPPLGTPLDWENPLNDETVLALAMNEGHGDKVQDLSLNGNHGTLHNFAFPPTAASGWNPGKTGTGLNFDGLGDHIDCGSAASLAITDAMTVSASVYFSSFPTSHPTIAGRRTDAGYDWQFRVVTATKKLSFLPTAGGAFEAGFINTNHRHIVAATFLAGTIELFIDGASLGSASGKTITATKPLTVGNTQHSSGEHALTGSVDQPRIQSRAWTAKEVRDYAINPWQVYLDEND